MHVPFWFGDFKKSGFVCSDIANVLCLGLEGSVSRNYDSATLEDTWFLKIA